MIYDDKRSIIHTILGALAEITGLSIEITILFSTYQLAEFIAIEKNTKQLLGDIIEYIIGLAIGYTLILYTKSI